MEEVIFSFNKIRVPKRTEDILEKYKDFLEEGSMTKAIEEDRISSFAVKIHEEVAIEDRDVIIAFVQMAMSIHRFSKAGVKNV